MTYRFFLCTILAIMLSACSTTTGTYDKPIRKMNFSGYYADKPIQCVPFAREVSGIPIYGDAHTWWYQRPEYKRGSKPQKGAVLVLAKTSRLRYGHLAVVKEVIGKRKMLVTHSNWGGDRKTRSFIYESMLVEDVSRHNDWSKLRFWNQYTNNFGSPYEAYGFIYPS